MRVKITKSPNSKKKFRATLEDGRTVDFGASGYSDYTKHKKIHERMLNVDYSFSENWGISGIDGAGFWSRWYLWSYPSFEGAKKIISTRFGVTFI